MENSFMMGESKIETLKYKDILKKPLFWISVSVLFVLNSVYYNLLYIKVLFSQYLGIFIGSFLLGLFIWGFTISAMKFFRSNKK